MEHQLHRHRSEKRDCQKKLPSIKEWYFQASTPSKNTPLTQLLHTKNISPIKPVAPPHGSYFPSRGLPLPSPKSKPIVANDFQNSMTKGKNIASDHQHESERMDLRQLPPTAVNSSSTFVDQFSSCGIISSMLEGNTDHPMEPSVGDVESHARLELGIRSTTTATTRETRRKAAQKYRQRKREKEQKHAQNIARWRHSYIR